MFVLLLFLLNFHLCLGRNHDTSSSSNRRVVQTEEDLSFNYQNRLTSNIVLFQQETCARELIQWNDENLKYSYHRQLYLMSNQFAESYQKDQQMEAGCHAVCISIGTLKEDITSQLPAYIYTRNDNFKQWHRLCQNVELGLLSMFDHDVIVLALDPIPDGTFPKPFTLQPNDLIWSTTPLCSNYSITSSLDDTVLSSFSSCYSGINVLNGSSATSGISHNDPSYTLPLSTLNTALQRYWNQSQYLSRTFTKFGFEKVRLPADLWSSISTYYHNNRHSLSIDYQQLENLHTVNWWNSTTSPSPRLKRIEIPPILKRYWSQLLCFYVELWSHGHPISPFSTPQKLQFISSSGFRVFSTGSYQLPHVEDPAHTAFTVVINIDQIELFVPWVAQIYDSYGRLHEVTMAPGDILVYESAKLLYGRMAPLDGTQYTDLLFHYRPLHPERWFLEENPEDGIAPLGDISDCHEELEVFSPQGLSSEEHVTEEEGIPRTVCTEVKTGKVVDLPFLSSPLRRITSGHELYQDWSSLAGIGKGGKEFAPTTVEEEVILMG